MFCIGASQEVIEVYAYLVKVKKLYIIDTIHSTCKIELTFFNTTLCTKIKELIKRMIQSNKLLYSILFFLFTSLSIAQVQVGSGSYTTNFPGADSAGRNGYPSGSPQLSGNALNKPVPTNDWWSKLVKEDQADNLFNYPFTMKTTSRGLIISYIPWGVIGDSAPIVMGLSGLSASRTTVSDYSDWTVSMQWSDSNQTMTATSGIGMPFIYFEKEQDDVVELTVNSGTVRIENEMLIVEDASHNADFVVYAPSGSSWSTSGNTYSSTLNNKTYWSVAMLPQSTTNVLQTATDFKEHAYVFPTNTTVAWNYSPTSSLVTSTFTVETEVKEGTNTRFLQGVLPHQWSHLASTSPTPDFTPYQTVRGEMKMLQGNTFTVENKFSGILPTLPYLNQYSEEFSPAELAEKITLLEDNQLDLWTDSYNEGQLMNRLIQTARIANEMGNLTARDKIISTVKERLEDWLKYSSGEVAFLFYYNQNWSSLIGYPAGHGQDNNINDHHFHWGYFIHAAAFLEQFQPGWVDQWGPMINLLVRDAASQNREDSQFPFLRNFSPYAGHSWANGFATFPQGNDQESTSESMQFNSSLIHWGTLTGQDDIRDLGIYLYTTEQTAIEEYWFDINERNFQPNQNYGLVSRVWGNSSDNGTFWTADITASYGIEFYPIHGGSFYLGRDKDYVQKIWTEIENYTEILNPNSDNPNLWYDTFWKYLALIDPEKAIDLYKKSPDRNFKFGISDAQTYHWLHSLNSIGLVDSSITANYPIASVFVKNGIKTYIAHNYSESSLDVLFSDGFTLTVPPNQMITNRTTNVSGELTTSFSQVYANGKVTLNLQSDDTTITKVEFYDGTTNIGTDNSSPYEITTGNLEIGKHPLFAKIYEGEAFELSNIVNVQVGEQYPYENQIHTLPGTIEAGHYDYFEGGNGQGISYLDLSPGNNGDFRPLEDVDAASVNAEGATIGWISSGEWLEYKIEVPQSGYYDFSFRHASGNSAGGGPFHLELDGESISGPISVPSTSNTNWDTWKTKTVSQIPLRKGEHILRVSFAAGEFNLGKMTFERTGNLPYQTPLADAGENTTVVLPETSVTLDGSGTTYEGTENIQYGWSQLYGPSTISFDNPNIVNPTLSNLADGVYKVKLIVTTGSYSDSDEIFIIVSDTGNNLPSVKLESPKDETYYKENDSIELRASASDLDGSIEKVEFYQGDQKIAESIEAPYIHTIENSSVGTFTFFAKAIDNLGGETLSEPKKVYVEQVKSCVETSTEAREGQFSIGYKATFESVGNDVTITFELLDTDKSGVIAYLFQENPFQESQLEEISPRVFRKTITGLTQGQQLSYACKFAFAGGLAVTKYISYTVGNDCSAENDVSPPTNVSATVNTVSASSVSFLVRGEDNSGGLIFVVRKGNEERLFTAESGVEKEIAWTGLNPETAYTFSISAKDASGNENPNTITLNTSTTTSANTACSGQAANAQQGEFQIGYNYSFVTQGSSVVVEFELLDEKDGVVAYLWKKTPFGEIGMTNIGGKRFQATLNNQTQGETITYACKFAFAGGLAVTEYLNYTVGDSCVNIPDQDSDGVPDSEDSCPNTPSGAMVDISGCEVFALAQDAFSVEVSASSCVDAANGSISIKANDSRFEYTVTSGQNVVYLNSSNYFTAEMTNLDVGSYPLCITVDGQSGYEQCYTVSITEPQPLSASAKVDYNAKKVSISMEGSERYYISLNGVQYDTRSNDINLDLRTGMNYLEVATDQSCQGIFTQEIFVSETILVYPNPTSDWVQIYVGGTDDSVALSVSDLNGNTLVKEELNIPYNRVIQFDLSSYKTGLYFIRLQSNTVQSNLKVLKK